MQVAGRPAGCRAPGCVQPSLRPPRPAHPLPAPHAPRCRFEGLTSIKRHRLVYSILEEELRSPVHALSLITKTPAEAGLA